MYQFGLGVEKNYNEARRWYRKASSLGDANAIELLKGLGEKQ